VRAPFYFTNAMLVRLFAPVANRSVCDCICAPEFFVIQAKVAAMIVAMPFFGVRQWHNEFIADF